MLTTAKAIRCQGLFMAIGVLLLISQRGAFADTPAQAGQEIQAVCDRGAAHFQQRDLDGYMAMFSPSFQLTNVIGHTYNFREQLASIADDFASPKHVTLHFRVGKVLLNGSTADTVINIHFSYRSAYTESRDCIERISWVQGKYGWQQVRARMTRDTINYQRLP